MEKLKNSKMKKLLLMIFVLVFTLAYAPVGVYASVDENAQSQYGTHEYWEQKYPYHAHVESIEPGQVFEALTYFIDKDITVNATAGLSGIIIKGDVTLIIEDNHTLSVSGGDTSQKHGAGAGVELDEGSSLHVKGTGTLKAKGGDVVPSEEFSQGGYGHAGEEEDTSRSGKSGNGGMGTGGAGAAVGSKGGDGGENGKAVSLESNNLNSDEPNQVDENGKKGENGKDGQASAKSGQLKISGNIQTEFTPGKVLPHEIQGHQSFGGKTAKTGFVRAVYYGGGGGGGNGGIGANAAAIGSGGSGGGGGASGGSGGICIGWGLNDWYINGGGGGAGAGTLGAYGGGAADEKGSFDHSAEPGQSLEANVLTGGKGGLGARDGDNETKNESSYGGTGGQGGSMVPSGDAGICYSTNRIESKQSTDETSPVAGKEATSYRVYPQDECRVTLVSFEGGSPEVKVEHIPTGHVLKLKVEYNMSCEKISNDEYLFKVFGHDMNIHHATLGDESMTKAGLVEFKYSEKDCKVSPLHFENNTIDGREIKLENN